MSEVISQNSQPTSSKLSLSLASTADIPTIFQLAKTIWNDHYVGIITQEQIDYMLQWMYSEMGLKEQMMEKKHRFYIIHDNGKEIGFVSFSGDQSNYFIHKFYILTSQQGKGIGAFVFHQIKALMGDVKTIRLTVNRKNFKSINFYFKLGFVIEKVEDFDIGNGWLMEDFVMLYK